MEIVVWVCGRIRHMGTMGSLREVLGVWRHLSIFASTETRSKEDTVVWAAEELWGWGGVS